MTAILAKALAICLAHICATEYDLEILYFEDLPLGGEWITRRRTISQADLTAFTGVAGDFNPLHVDEEHARTTHFGGVLVHAGLIASAAIGLGSMDAPVPATVGMLGMNWKFLKPVRVGDSIRGRWRLARVRKVNNQAWGVAVWQVAVENQRGEKVAEGEITRLVARRGDTTQAHPEVAAVDVAAADSARIERPARRRGSGRGPQTPTETILEEVVAEAPPEPAPADVPSPSRRRRRGRGRSGSGAGQAAAGSSPAEPPAPAPEPIAVGDAGAGASGGTSSSSRRRRRGRGRSGSGSSGSGTGTGSANGSGSEPGPAPSTPPPAPASAPARPAAAPAPADGGGRLGRVLRRLRGT